MSVETPQRLLKVSRQAPPILSNIFRRNIYCSPEEVANSVETLAKVKMCLLIHDCIISLHNCFYFILFYYKTKFSKIDILRSFKFIG